VSQPGEPTSDGAAEPTTGPDVPPVERPTSEKSPAKPSPKPSPRRRGRWVRWVLGSARAAGPRRVHGFKPQRRRRWVSL